MLPKNIALCLTLTFAATSAWTKEKSVERKVSERLHVKTME